MDTSTPMDIEPEYMDIDIQEPIEILTEAMDIEAIKQACLDAQAVIDAAEEKKGDK